MLMNTHVPNIVRPSDIRTLELKAEKVLLQGYERRWEAYGFKNPELPQEFSAKHTSGRGEGEVWLTAANVSLSDPEISRFSCVRLCDPIDGSPPGSPIPGILHARTLEWVAISFSNA